MADATATAPGAGTAGATGPTTGPTTGPGTDPARRGRLRVADRALQRIAVRAAEGVDGVLPGAVGTVAGLLGSGLPAVELERAGRHVRVQVDVAVRWPAPAPRVAAQVRDAVSAQVGRTADLVVDAVSVTVRDVVRAPKGPAPVRVVR